MDRRTNRLRVLHVSPGKLYGGVETILNTLARFRRLCPALEPHFALSYPGRISNELAGAGVPVHMLGPVRIGRPWTVWVARQRLRKLLQVENYDAVLCHMPWSMVVFGPTARSAAPLIFWAHGSHSAQGWLEKMARRVTPDLVIANSKFVGATVGNLYPRVDTELLYYPVATADAPEAAQWRSAVRRDQSVDDDTVVIVQVSRFEKWKGHLLHLQALSQLRTARKWACWMVGGPQNAEDQGHYDEVRRTAGRLGLAERVRFLGQRSDVARVLAGADVFCQPNQGPEPFGIVFVEALWAGLPVVSTAMGGAAEIVDESCGLLAEPDNAGHLAMLLERLIDSAELRARLGEAGPVRARQLCDPALQLNRLHHLVEQSIQKRLPLS